MYSVLLLFFFHDPAPTEIYTLSLHDALPICPLVAAGHVLLLGRAEGLPSVLPAAERARRVDRRDVLDRKSTRLNSSHVEISYAVFCLKKKKRPEDIAGGRNVQARHHRSLSLR